MTEVKKRSRKPRRTYVHRSNALCITLHSPDGSSVPKQVFEEAVEAVSNIAVQNRLVVNLAEV